MTMNATLFVVFWSSYETRAKDNNEIASSLYFVFFSWVVEHNDESLDLSLSSTTQEKKKTKHRKLKKDNEPSIFCNPRKKPLCWFFLVVGDNDEPPNSSLSLTFFYSLAEDNNEPRSQLIVIFGYFSLVAKDDEDKPLGLSSNLCVFFLSCRWWWWARILTHHHPLLFFFRCKRQQQASQLLVVFYIFFLQL